MKVSIIFILFVFLIGCTASRQEQRDLNRSIDKIVIDKDHKHDSHKSHKKRE